MTETKQIEKTEAVTEGETRELKDILEQLKDHNITKPIDVQNGTYKLDRIKKLSLVVRMVDYDLCKKLDHESWSCETLSLEDIVMIHRHERLENNFTIYLQRNNETMKSLDYWADSKTLSSGDSTIHINLSEEEAEDLENWLNEKMEA